MATEKTKILIAEDDPFLSKVVGATLQQEGFEVDHAKNGQEAIDLAGKNKYKVILLDLIMPIKNGFDVLNFLKKEKIKTPVLVFTNLSQEEDKKEVMELGAKGFYIKSSIAINELIEIVHKFVKS